MTKIQCPRQSCKKEFETPVMVTSYSFTPTKQIYPACPYCLARIDKNSKSCSCTTEVIEPASEKEPENDVLKQNWIKRAVSDSATMEKIGKLEKQKTDLLEQLEELKKDATKRISKLEQDVAALKEQKQTLKEITE
jgi:hypothetical protein